MSLLINKICSFTERVRWMAPLVGGAAAAVGVLMRIRKEQNAVQQVTYRGARVFFRGCDEQALREVLVDQEYAFLTQLLPASLAPKILDVGAHIGTFAIWALGVNPRANLVSVEADPATYRLISLNAENMKEHGAEWQVVHGAAGSKDGGVLRFSDAGPSMSHRIDPDGGIEVLSVSLPALLDMIAPGGGEVDLVKVDVEGSEEAFLCSSPDSLVRIKSLVVELHPALCDADRVRAMLEEHFDSVENIGGRKSTKPLLYCRRDIMRAA